MGEIIVESGRPYFEFSLPVGVSYMPGIPSSSVLRIGEFYGPSKCTILVNEESQIDTLIERLLEIKNLLTTVK